VLRDHRGVYLVVVFGHDGSVSIASDPLGTYPWFVHDTPERVVVSNNVLLIEQVLTTLGAAPARNGDVFAQELVARSAVRGRVGVNDIRLVPVGHGARLRQRAAPRLELLVDPVTPPSSGDHREVTRASEHLPAAVALAVDQAAMEIRENVRAVARSSYARRVCDLTGGADSRVVLAALLAEGIEDDFEYHCIGEHPGPDYAASAYLQDLLGLTETSLDPPSDWADLRPDPVRSMGAFMHRTMGCTAFFNDLSIGTPPAHDRIQVGGGLAGSYKGFHAGAEHVHTLPESVAFLRGEPFPRKEPPPPRPAGFTAGFHERLDVELRLAVDEAMARGGSSATLEGVLDRWYLDNRNRYHFGLSWHLVNRHRPQFQPLYSLATLWAARSLEGPERRGNRVGFELLRRLYEPLLALPFAEARWAASVVATHPDAALLAEVRPFTRRSPRVSPAPGRRRSPSAQRRSAPPSDWEREQRRRGRPTWWYPFDSVLPAARDYVSSFGPDHVLWDTFDRRDVETILARPLRDGWNGYDIRLVYRLLGAAIWTARDEIAVPVEG
jgi:hypothetical protein